MEEELSYKDLNPDATVAMLIKEGSPIHDFVQTQKLYDKVPPLKLKKLTFEKEEPVVISGPYNRQIPATAFKRAFGQTISTYPFCLGRKCREGDPICDSYGLKVYKGYQIFCVADGCGWGERPKEASNRLKDSFLEYFEGKTFKTLREIATHLVNACAFANYCISYGKQDIWMAGTSTGLGGLIVELEEKKKKKKKNETNNVPPWAFVFLSIGDCKCFKWDCALKTCTDITAGNRVHVTDARDPGGRLGPQKKDGQPDLRNLDMFWVGCNEGDIIMTMSDGVHDNLDPQALGHVPSEFGQKVDSWDDIDPKLCTDIKTKFMNDLITKIITTDISEVPQSFMNDPLPLSTNTEARPVTPALITKRLVRYCLKLTRNAREWMEQNPNGTLESDYQKYPGKLDHTTCVACMVGTHEPNVEEEEAPDNGQTSSLRPEVWPY